VQSLQSLSGVELAALIARGESSCEEVARAVLARIAEREAVLQAWAFLDPELVLAQARALDAATERGPLHGVPIGIKDIIDTADMPTQMGSPIYAGHRPKADAACVALLRAAGALIVGKTVTAEFAGIHPGPTTNPHDPARTPGGSSSGSAAAVAAGMIPIALGTQTGGSVQRPASFCGVVGFKPSRGYVNRAGVKPAAESLDVVGILASDVADAALCFAPLTNRRPAPLRPRAPQRVGICRTPLWSRAQTETVEAVENAAAALRTAGVPVVEIELPPAFDELSAARDVVNAYQRAHGMAYEWREHRDALSATLTSTIRRGLALPPERIAEALTTIERCRALIAPVFAETELLLAPCVDGEAPLGLSNTGENHFQSFWTMLDAPTVGLPTHRGPNGMPVSIQLAAATFNDFDLLAMAAWVSACC
jgi:amidase